MDLIIHFIHGDDSVHLFFIIYIRLYSIITTNHT